MRLTPLSVALTTLKHGIGSHGFIGSFIFQQHHIEGENNKVRSVSLSSYEPSVEKDVTLPKKKRDILAVCLAHLVVVWTVAPGLQWTVLHKWSLPTVRKQLIEILFLLFI